MRLGVLAATVGLLLPVSALSQESGSLFSANDLYSMCDAQSVACLPTLRAWPTHLYVMAPCAYR
jgi:hypothetical protein